MSEVVENVSELQNSAPSNEAALSTEPAVSKEVTNNVEIVDEAVPDAIETAPTTTTETGEESSQKPVAEESSSVSPKVDNKKTPVKRTRMSFIERAQKESEELVRTLGGSLEMEGGRKTRSSTRGTPTRSAVVSTPPPAKKSRASPASGASTPTRARGRGRKLETTTDGSAEEESSPTTSKKKTPAKGKKTAAAKESLEDHHEDNEKKNVEETEKKLDDSKSEVDSTKESHVDTAAAAAEVVGVETKSIEALDHIETETETNKEVETENVIDKAELKAEDETDAILEPVVEETESQVAVETNTTAQDNSEKEPENVSHVEKVIEESENNDSAMEVDEVKPVVSEENEKHDADNTSAIKEPTPEPMDVDASSKSDEALEKLVDNVSEDVVEAPAPKENVEQITKEVDSNSFTVEAEASSTNACNLNDVNTVEENVPQTTLVTEEVSTPASEVVENNTLGAKLVNEPTVAATNVALEKSTEETTPAAHNDLNKTENDLCEPKIATSPPISAANDNNGTVTTPQTCN